MELEEYESLDESLDPWAPQNVPVVQTIVLMRIYDALMLILNNLDEAACESLTELHESGVILSDFPSFKGNVEKPVDN